MRSIFLSVRPSRADATDFARSVGGLLFAAGAVVLLARKSGDHGWSDLAQMLVVLIPALVLYTLALAGQGRTRVDRLRPWQAVLMVESLLLWPLALIGFLSWLGAPTKNQLYLAGVFTVTSLLAVYAVYRARIGYAALLAGLSSLIAWLYVWEQILSHTSANTGRWLLVVAGALLLILATGLARRNAIGASECATVGGIAAVAAGVLGVIVGGAVAAFGPLMALTEGSSTHGQIEPRPLALHHAAVTTGAAREPGASMQAIAHVARHTSGLQHLGWDIYLLVISVALIWGAARWRVRGLGYVGGLGLLAFVASVAAQVTRLEAGRAPSGAIVGWPLVLLVIGVLGLLAPAVNRRRA